MSVSRGSIAYLTGLPIKVASENSVVLQVSAYDKRITKGIYRYRCEINDGQQRVWAMFGTQCTEDFDNQTIIPGSIIRINNAMNTEGKNAVRMLVVMSFELVQREAALLMEPLLHKQEEAEALREALRLKEEALRKQEEAMNPVAAPVAPVAPAAPAQTYGGYIGGNDAMETSPAPPAAPVQQGPWNGGYSGSGVSTSPVKPNFPMQENLRNQQVTPIHALNPYSNRWTIKARITQKGDKKSWDNAKGKGTLFSMTLIDSSKHEIRGTFFKDACEKFYPLLKEGSVYYFQGGKLKPVTNRQYTNIKSDYEITFDAQSNIVEAEEDTSIVEQNYEFVKIADINALEAGATIDVLGLVKSAQDCSAISSQKLGKDIYKRDLVIMDDSMSEIRLTLWGAQAQNQEHNWDNKPIVAFKGVKVGEYSGRSLSLLQSGSMMIAPKIPEGQALFNWVKTKMEECDGDVSKIAVGSLSAGGGGGRAETFENRKWCQYIKDNGLGQGDKADWCTMKLCIFYIKSDNEPWYTSCANCKKKVTEAMDSNGGGWRCEKCNTDSATCMRRYILSAQMGDHSGSNWFSLFDSEASQLLGYSADQLHAIKNDPDSGEDKYKSIIEAANFKQFIIKSKVKAEDMNNGSGSRVKCTVNSLEAIDYKSECSKMIEAIKKYQATPGQ